VLTVLMEGRKTSCSQLRVHLLAAGAEMVVSGERA
jgi:hypothetical protein